MFEDIIATLDGMGIAYTEDPEMGTLSIDTEPLDKVQLLDLWVVVNDVGAPVTVEGTTITITGGPTEPMEEEPMEEAPAEEDAQMAALNQMMM